MNLLAAVDGAQKFVECAINEAELLLKERDALKASNEELLKAVKLQHKSVDILFAKLIASDREFFPSRSGEAWENMIKAHEIIAKQEAKL